MRIAVPRLLLLSFLLAGCSSAPVSEKPANADRATPADISALVQGNNRFSLDLLRRLAPGENVVVSPFGVALAMSLTFANNEADALPRSLHVPFSQDRLNTTYAGLLWKVQSEGRPRPYQLDLASSVWLTTSKDFRPDAEYVEKAKANYTAPPHSVDFLAGGVGRINSWCSEKTRGKIAQILSPEDVDDQTVALVASAVYFKGNWASKFKKSDTRTRVFHFAPQRVSDAEFMHQTLRTGYASTEDAQVLELTYQGEDLSLFVLLPRNPDGLAAMEKNLTHEQLDGWMSTLSRKEVVVSLPRFTIAGNAISLGATLEEMNWPVKQPPAIGTIESGAPLKIDRVLQRGFIEVNEEGSEVAVKTGAVPAKDSPLPSKEAVTFTADHPFLFLIRHNPTGCVLLAGRLVEVK